MDISMQIMTTGVFAFMVYKIDGSIILKIGLGLAALLCLNWVMVVYFGIASLMSDPRGR